MADRSVYKQSAVIQSENKVSLIQRKSWNVLLSNAYDDLCKIAEAETFSAKDLVHEIPVKEFAFLLGIEEDNYSYFKMLLSGLTKTSIEYNLLEKDKENLDVWKKWETFTLLSYASLERGSIKYSYSLPLIKKLANPKMYAKFALLLQRQFKSKHGLALFELCTDYYDDLRGKGETPWITLEVFRKMMSLSESHYKSFKHLNRDVIKKSLSEINTIAPFVVECMTKKEGRAVSEIKFVIKSRKDKKDSVKLLKTTAKDLKDMKEGVNDKLFEKLVFYGIGDVQARKILVDYYDDRILKNIEYIEKKYVNKGKIKEGVENFSGILVSAIENDYAKRSSFEFSQEQKEKEKQESVNFFDELQKIKAWMNEQEDKKFEAFKKEAGEEEFEKILDDIWGNEEFKKKNSLMINKGRNNTAVRLLLLAEIKQKVAFVNTQEIEEYLLSKYVDKVLVDRILKEINKR